MRKLVQSMCAPIRSFRREFKKNSTTAFYPIYYRCAPYKNISLTHYRVPR